MNHEQYMQHCLDLAAKGRGYVEPNPLVGCLIVHQEEIIGEGFHESFGEAHAEVNAIQSVQKQELLSQSTLYVNLEPCAHHGKTPPCCDLLLKHHIPKVVIGMTDVNPEVRGRGIQNLSEAGCEVVVGVLEDSCAALNRRFIVNQVYKRPYVILKWAQTRDGFLAREDYSSKWISNEQSRNIVHEWRSQESAILVGTNTAVHDNPRLTARVPGGRNPLRILLDRSLRVPEGHALFDGSEKTLIYNEIKSETTSRVEFVQLEFTQSILSTLLNDLQRRGVWSLLVEGGATLLSSFLAEDLWDEARVFTAPHDFEGGIAAPELAHEPSHTRDISGDALETFERTDRFLRPVHQARKNLALFS